MQILPLTKKIFCDTKDILKSEIDRKFEYAILNLIEKKPFGKHKFYDFIFPKRATAESTVQILYHQPRLTKPDPLPGTTLLKLDPDNPEKVIIIWILPHIESINLFKKGKIFENKIVHDSIRDYLYDRKKLIRREADDLTDENILEIYKEISNKNLSSQNS